MRAGATHVGVVRTTLRVAWNGQPLLHGTLVGTSDAPDAYVTARIDGDAVYVSVVARPCTGAAPRPRRPGPSRAR